MRRFELSEGTAHKFWEIMIAGRSITVRYGRIGTDGRAQTKELGDDSEARDRADKMIREKLRKGYLETTPKPSATSTDAGAERDAGLAMARLVTAVDATYREIQSRHPLVWGAPREPASEAALLAFETKVGARLPPDYRAFLQINRARHSFLGNYECLDLAGVMGAWEVMTKHLDDGVFDDGRLESTMPSGNWDDGRLKSCWWSRRWIPFAQDACFNLYCVDLDPGPNGVSGQVVEMEVQDGQGPFASEHASFAAFFEGHLELLEAKRWRVEDGLLELDP